VEEGLRALRKGPRAAVAGPVCNRTLRPPVRLPAAGRSENRRPHSSPAFRDSRPPSIFAFRMAGAGGPPNFPTPSGRHHAPQRPRGEAPPGHDGGSAAGASPWHAGRLLDPEPDFPELAEVAEGPPCLCEESSRKAHGRRCPGSWAARERTSLGSGPFGLLRALRSAQGRQARCPGHGGTRPHPVPNPQSPPRSGPPHPLSGWPTVPAAGTALRHYAACFATRQ